MPIPGTHQNPTATPDSTSGGPARIRWWPAAVVLALAALAVLCVQAIVQFPFQRRNLISLGIGSGAAGLLLVWWIAFSRARWALRLMVLAAYGLPVGSARLTLRLRGVTGDLLPIVEARWADTPTPATSPANGPGASTAKKAASTPDRPRRVPGNHPGFLGPNRDGTFPGPAFRSDWQAHPPQELWRQPMGPAWSGFSVVDDRAVTQEQAGDDESVTCRDLFGGTLLWRTTNPGGYATLIAGKGPRCSPAIEDGLVVTLGAKGWLQVLDLRDGRRLWGTNILEVARAGMPEWGLSGSPLVVSNRVFVSAGGQDGRSLLVWDLRDGRLLASGGSASAEYSSPFLTVLAGVPQILQFNHRQITSHDPLTARVLWSRPFGVQFPLVANPVRIPPDRVLLSAGYGVGSELLEISRNPEGGLTAAAIWSSKRLKAKFANPFFRDGFVYGLDDGILACIDAKDGSQRWKEGRHGHGQGVVAGDLYLLMAEQGEMVLLRPTPEGPGELSRLKVFTDKTWNPIALAGDLLLVRNDREAACYRLAVR